MIEKSHPRPLNMGNMESLLFSENIGQGRWYPISIDAYKNDLRHGIFDTLNSNYRSNIAYNLQYLEYLDLQLRELNLSSVIRAMIFKNFIVVAASIIEIAFYHLAKQSGKIKLRTFREVYKQDIRKPKDIKNVPKSISKFTLIGLEKLPQGVEDQTRFETLISIVRDNKLLDTDISKSNEYLKILRKLRNKIHLTTACDSSQTDYNKFFFADYLRAKYFLFIVLTDGKFGGEKQVIFPSIRNSINQQISNYMTNKTQIYLWIN
jgi:hypothetical protein